MFLLSHTSFCFKFFNLPIMLDIVVSDVSRKGVRGVWVILLESERELDRSDSEVGLCFILLRPIFFLS